jgi:hypothetical protein
MDKCAHLKEKHMHETKVNTLHYGPTTSKEKNMPFPAEFVGRIETPYGIQYVSRGAATDHAYMRSQQLTSLLMLIQGDGRGDFLNLGAGTQESLLWLAVQLAGEMEEMVHILVADVQEARA